MIDTRGAVRLREEREQLNAKKRKCQNCEKKKEAAIASAFTTSSSSKGTQRNGIDIRKNPLTLLRNRKETEEEEVMDVGGEREGTEMEKN